MVEYHLSRKEDQVGVCVWYMSGNASFSTGKVKNTLTAGESNSRP